MGAKHKIQQASQQSSNVCQAVCVRLAGALLFSRMGKLTNYRPGCHTEKSVTRFGSGSYFFVQTFRVTYQDSKLW